MKAKRSNTRIRPMSCDRCGYHVYGTRSWWLKVGLQRCNCGGTIKPDKPADLAYCGIITQDDVSQAEWNAICRENDWQIIRNQGQQARGDRWSTSDLMRERVGAAHCAHPGCGRWVAAEAEYCTAGHPQSENVSAPAEAIPF